jgi:hypothetical protein
VATPLTVKEQVRREENENGKRRKRSIKESKQIVKLNLFYFSMGRLVLFS